MKIGIFGGSFNPIHQGHLKLASFALSELNLDKVVFVPSFQTPLKEGDDLLPAKLRLSLTKLAVKNNRKFEVSDVEIRRKGVSYTVDTLRSFKKMYGRDAVLYFLTGADTLENIFRWKSLDRVLELCRFVVLARPGYAMIKKVPGTLLLPMDALSVSSSQVRERLAEGKSVLGLVPKTVIQPLKRYIQGGLPSKRKKK